MFIKKSSVDEIANAMERHLVDGVINKQAEQQEQLVKAANYLNAAAEICDESGLNVQAELITAVLESLAAKKSKKKVKSKPKSKTKTKSPSSEKMVSNLKEKGWVFDENGADDTNFVDDNCALCGDISYSKDKKKEHWHLEKSDDPNHTSNFTGSKEELDKRLHVTEPFNGKWDAHGPYESHDELERKHNPNWFRDDGSFKLYDDSEADDEMIEPEYWWRLTSLSPPRSYYDFKATESDAFARKEEREQYAAGECELDGPFKHKPSEQHTSLDEMASDDKEESTLSDPELLSMLNDFKTRSGDEDFEDEDLSEPDRFSEESIHPDYKLNKVDLEDAAYPDVHEDWDNFNVRRDPIQQKQNDEYRRMLDNDEDADLDDRGGVLTHQLIKER